MHKILLDHLAILARQCAFHIRVHHALRAHFVFYVVIHQLAVVLCAHARKRFAFSFRNSQFLKCFLDVFGHIFPFCRHFGFRLHIRHDFLNIEVADVWSPFGNIHLIVDFQRFQAKLPHPFRVVFLCGNALHDCFV